MRIVFDGTTLRPYQTGVGYYSEHLLQHLLREAPEDEFVIVSNRSVHTSNPLPDQAHVFQDGRFPIRNLWMQMLAPRVLRAIEPKLVHFTNSLAPVIKRVPTVITIHDMSLTLFPKLHPLRRLMTRPLINRAARTADGIITVSHSARKDILRFTSIAADRIHVIYEAAASAFRPLEDRSLLEAVRQRYGLADRFILYVGTIEPRKNLVRLLEAYADLHRHGALAHQLVCVGPLGWGYQEVRRSVEALGLQKSVLLTGYVPFDDLPAFYNLSEIFVFPSLHEGFGLPVLEAMASGVPVITAGNSALGEIAGDAARAMDPLQTESIAEALVRLANNRDLRRDLVERGLKRAKRFSWKKAARETLAVYRKISSPW